MNEITNLGVAELSRLIGAGKLSPVELVEATLGRIEALGFKTSWVTGKPAAEMKPFGGQIPGSPNAWALRVEVGDARMDYLVGFFGRLFTELMTPGDLLRMVRTDAERPPIP